MQTVKEHLTNVSQIAASNGEKIEVGHMTYVAGLLHDSGKLSTKFKDYILQSVNDATYTPKRGSVDHSTAGGKILFEKFHKHNSNVSLRIIVELLCNTIISHHNGLTDFLSPTGTSTYLRRLKDKEIDNFDEIIGDFFNEISSLELLEEKLQHAEVELKSALYRNHQHSKSKDPNITITLLMKYVFSCLIDADRTDARCFDENINSLEQANNGNDFNLYYSRLIRHLDLLNKANTSKSRVDKLRENMSEQCEVFADRPSGIYTLSIPTGGGKTLSSLRYAIKHAIKFNKDRIIYVVPYTSIIEQNAKEVREILKDNKNILEHHSNIIENEDDGPYENNKTYQLARDNWHSPIIFTTMVQFLNTIYSNKTRDIRRFHQLANSIIIFDEVQSVPVKCIALFNESLNFLTNVCNTSILLCTATQPALDFVDKKLDKIDGEVVSNLSEVTKSFKRVEIIDKTKHDGWSTGELVTFINENLNEETRSILIVLNTKTVVKNLYKRLRQTKDAKVYHLSTSMCAAHRSTVLNKIKSALLNKERVVCVSTQLIEAGVNISFECVVRSLSGVDSIAQAAGRCNRHGEVSTKNVYVINHREESLNHLKNIKTGAEITNKILLDKKYGHVKEDLLSPKIMSLYFTNYYTELQNKLEYPIPSLQDNLYELTKGSNKYKEHYRSKSGRDFPLALYSSVKTVGDYFQVIDQKTTSVLVPYGEGADIISELNGELAITELSLVLRRAQHYVVNVYDFELQKLSKSGGLVYLLDDKVIALKENAYDLDFGVSTDEEGKMSTLTI
ncbi:CRISPR-associated helicase Cas3' [Proteinivorax hydrogeniformans]|uniref:CRISPR-associated helicase Cas3 n=1 Tax=Proteinivorax hydrogeniformans TaxID=1826727 RepID=A0AAU8HX86_9FIRM